MLIKTLSVVATFSLDPRILLKVIAMHIIPGKSMLLHTPVSRQRVTPQQTTGIPSACVLFIKTYNMQRMYDTAIITG